MQYSAVQCSWAHYIKVQYSAVAPGLLGKVLCCGLRGVRRGAQLRTGGWRLSTARCTLHTAHCTSHTPHRTPHAVHRTLHSAHYPLPRPPYPQPPSGLLQGTRARAAPRKEGSQGPAAARRAGQEPAARRAGQDRQEGWTVVYSQTVCRQSTVLVPTVIWSFRLEDLPV